LRFVTRVKQNERATLAVMQSHAYTDLPQRATVGEVTVSNPLYTFSLRRSREGSPWVITDVAPRRAGQAPDAFSDAEAIRRTTAAVLTLTNGKSLEELLGQPNFRLLDAAETLHDGTPAVSVRFENLHELELGDEAFFPIQAGTIILDPKQSWCVRSAELDCLYGDGRATEQIEWRYRPSADGLPLPVSYRNETVRVDEAGRAWRTSVNQRFEFTVAEELPDDSAFTLTAFGFPEPEFAAKGSNLYLWLGATGVLCLITAIALRRLLRRRSTVQ
jgi:hypothetical protein